ncbi:MAG: hypothetical protein QXU36_08165 [Thermofilum sp.]|uniref:Uncharacterized protein n=2 Tax=Thermofilaceae TaxID=114378 RepID=S5ZF78_9CREN|nr:hypothetical protein N186_07375 [Thermofilum adornatum]
MLLKDVLKDLVTKLGEEESLDKVLVVATGSPEVIHFLLEALPEDTYVIITRGQGLSMLGYSSRAERLIYGYLFPFRNEAFNVIICFAWDTSISGDSFPFSDVCKLARRNGYIICGTWTPGSFIGSKNSELYAKQLEDIRKNLPERFSCVDVRITREYILVTCKCIPPSYLCV